MKYKIGDQVRVRKDLEDDKRYGYYWLTQEMTQFKGKVVEIISRGSNYYTIKEDKGRWKWSEEMFELPEYTYKDLCKRPIGTKVVFDCGEVLIRTGEELFNNSDTFHSVRVKNLKELEHESFGKIIKIEEPSYTTVYEATGNILDEVEKEYLGNVIKPFRDRVISIAKVESICGDKYIAIGIDDKDYVNYINFPYLKDDTMYKGMEIDKRYGLEDLKL